MTNHFHRKWTFYHHFDNIDDTSQDIISAIYLIHKESNKNLTSILIFKSLFKWYTPNAIPMNAEIYDSATMKREQRIKRRNKDRIEILSQNGN